MNSQAGESNSGAAVRGLLLVLVAVVVGVLLLRSVDDPDSTTVTDTAPPPEAGDTLPPAAPETTPSTSAPAAADSGAVTVSTVQTSVTAPVTETTSAAAEPFQPRSAAEVSVQVANSTTVRGAAGRLTDRFKTLSYITKTPTNYSGTPLDSTVIYYKPGSLLEGRAIAGVLGLDADEDVRQMPADTSAVDGFESPDVLVALGNDLAE